MARKASRIMAIPIWSTKENRLIKPGETVPLDHLSDEDYDRFTRLYPDDLSAAEQKRIAREQLEQSGNRESLGGE